MAENDKKYLSRDAILNAPDVVTEEVQVPEWGGVVLVRGMTGTQRDQFEQETMEMSSEIGKGKRGGINLKLKSARAKLASMCMVDENGKQLFSLKDVEALGDKSAKALDRIYGVAQRLSGISEKDMEELVKN